MNQSRLRLTIFIAWASALLFSILAAFLAPVFSRGGAIQDSQISPLVRNIIGIYLPALSCLAGFWFPSDERTQASKHRLTRERGIVALVVTFGYLGIVILLVFWPMYITDYTALGPNLPPGRSLEERVTEAIGIAAMLSPLALLPIHFLTSTVAAVPSTGKPPE
jgi:hypothetical protein